jgi:TonB-dependent receptor
LKDFVVRGAYTTGMGRPDLGQILPGKTIYQNYNLIKMTNPKLLPQTNNNYDLKLEYYLPKSGSLTFNAFHQDINRYIHTVDVVIPDYPNPQTGDLEVWDLQQPQNGGKGKNDGIEISYRQRLGFISPWLDKFEFYTAFSTCNPKFKYQHYTAPVPSGDALKGIDPDSANIIEDYLNSPTELVDADIPNIVKKTANARLTYTGTKFSGGIAVIWRGEYTKSINTGNEAETKQAAAYTVDLSLGYKLSPRWRAYFDWRNASKTPDERHIFNRTGGYYTSGMAINLGIRADL